MNTVPESVQKLYDLTKDMGSLLVEAEPDEDWPWQVALAGFLSMGEMQADYNPETDTFDIWQRAYDLSGGISVEDRLDSDLTAEQAAHHMAVKWGMEKQAAEQMDRMMEESEAEAWGDEQ